MDYPANLFERSEAVKRKARNLGFGDCKICTADAPPERDGAALKDWLAQGMHGTMTWFERSAAARTDPKTRFPWAKSVIVVRGDYAADRPDLPPDSVGKRIARYALGLDYHDTFKESLEALEKFMVKMGVEVRRVAPEPDQSATGVTRHAPTEPTAQALWYQDTGPFLEHVYAQRAGIGWTGKHTLTLDALAGSYFFLAEIITSIELAPDAPATNHCGTCTACIDACPTGAILEPYKLDARRCISYLTIEHKGPVAPELRDKLSGYVFGCDICQEVCPYNKKRAERDGPRPTKDALRAPLLEALTLDDVLTLNDDTFAEALKDTPLERSGPARLKRNAALLAGTERNVKDLKGLLYCLTHVDVAVREAAAWALGNLGGTPHEAQARQRLGSHQRHESDERVRDVVIEALSKLTASP